MANQLQFRNEALATNVVVSPLENSALQQNIMRCAS